MCTIYYGIPRDGSIRYSRSIRKTSEMSGLNIEKKATTTRLIRYLSQNIDLNFARHAAKIYYRLSNGSPPHAGGEKKVHISIGHKKVV